MVRRASAKLGGGPANVSAWITAWLGRSGDCSEIALQISFGILGKKPIGTAAGQQLVEQNSKLINVCRRRDGLAEDLLWTGIPSFQKIFERAGVLVLAGSPGVCHPARPECGWP